MILSLLLSCAAPVDPVQDAQLLAQVLSHADDPLAFETCGRVVDPSTREECQLMAAVRGAQLRSTDPEADCQKVDAGQYRDECFFLSAEYWRRRSKMERAGALCARSGRFAVDCRQHLWQTAVRTITMEPKPFDALLSDVSRVYCNWQPILGDAPDFEWRFWDRVWEGGLETRKPLDLAHCEVLVGGQLEYCQKAGAKRLMVVLEEDLVHPDARAAFCASDPLQGRLGDFVPHPVLDAVVLRHREALCVQGLERPENMEDPEIFPAPGTQSGVVCPER